MPTIIIGGNSYPSNVTVAEADEYLAVDPFRGPAWATYTVDQKGMYLIAATRALLGLSWCGTPPDPDNASELVKEVTILFAADIGADPSILAGPSSDGEIKRAKAGAAEVEFFRGEPVSGGPPAGFPAGLWAMLKAAGLVGCGSSSLAAPFILGGDCHSHFDYYHDHGCSRCAPLAKCQCNGYMPC